MTMRWLLVILLAAACGGPPATTGPIKPAAAGPVDLLRGIWGDYGGRCPDQYQYCKGQRQAVCCPITSQCAEDAGGSYCASRTGDPEAGVGATAPSTSRCGADEIACSYHGQTTCCAGDQRCCTVDGAPSCCR